MLAKGAPASAFGMASALVCTTKQLSEATSQPKDVSPAHAVIETPSTMLGWRYIRMEKADSGLEVLNGGSSADIMLE